MLVFEGKIGGSWVMLPPALREGMPPMSISDISGKTRQVYVSICHDAEHSCIYRLPLGTAIEEGIGRLILDPIETWILLATLKSGDTFELIVQPPGFPVPKPIRWRHI